MSGFVENRKSFAKNDFAMNHPVKSKKTCKNPWFARKKCRTFAKFFGDTGNSLSIRGIFDDHGGTRKTNIFKIRRPQVIPLEQGLRLHDK